MKKKRLEMRVLLCMCAAMGWWGMLYPQLSMTKDTYRIVYEEEAVEESVEEDEWDFDSNILERIMKAEDGKVRVRSKLWMLLEAFFKER